MDKQNVRVNGSVTISFGSLCWIAWLVFLILKLTDILPEAFTWFWVWFPFWLPFAVSGVLWVFGILCALILDRLDK